MRIWDAWHAGDFWRPYFLYVGLSALYALFAAGIVAFWAPEAAGSGMPEIKVSARSAAQRADGQDQSMPIMIAGCCAPQAVCRLAMLAVRSAEVPPAIAAAVASAVISPGRRCQQA